MKNHLEGIGLERPRFGEFVRQVSSLRTEELEECLAIQRKTGGRIGRILQDNGTLTAAQIREVLRMQARWVARVMEADVRPRGFPYPTFFSLCMPAFNEKDNIEDTLETACCLLPEFVERFEVVVVDDGSRDDTAAIVRRCAERHEQVRLVTHEVNRGYGAAVTSALRAARGELVAFTDSDGQFSLLDLPLLLAQIDKYDAVLGYRYRRADAPMRLFNAWAWGWLIRLTLGVRIRDLDCAFKVFRREVLDRLRLTSTGATINAEILAQFVRGGVRMVELPVNHFPRYAGAPTGAAFKVIARAFRELPSLLRYRFDSTPLLERPPVDDDDATQGTDGVPDSLAPSTTDAAPPNGAAVFADQPARNGTDALPTDASLRVCMLAACPFPANHGTPGSIREMAEALTKQGHEVHVVTYHYGEKIPVEGPHIHRIPALTREDSVVVGPTVWRPLYDILLVFKALQVIWRHSPHVIHAHNYEAALAAGVCRYLFRVKTPIVYSGHNTMSDELPSYNFIRPRILAVWLARFLDYIVPRFGHRCIPHSKNLQDFFHGQGLAERTEPVVPFGIDITWASQGDGQRVREQFELGTAPVILYTGVLDQFQRLDLLLEAMKFVADRGLAARLLVVRTIPGDKHLEALRAQAESLGIGSRVSFTEPQALENIPDFLAAADVTVVPRPRTPGFPFKLLNYMAARKPCVMFASSASQGMIHGHNAYLVETEEGAALGQGIVDLLDNAALRQQLGANAYEFLCIRHDRGRIASALTSCFRQLVPVQIPSPPPSPFPSSTSPRLPAASDPSDRNAELVG